MSDTTRRGFLALAGVGAVAGVTGIGSPRAGASGPAEDVMLPAGIEGDMAAYIYDLQTGQIALMVEDHEVIVTDEPLVARLAQAFARAMPA